MSELTQTEWNVYGYLLVASERGDVPTYEQIGTACGMRSKEHVGKVIRKLCKKGLVRHRDYGERALTVFRAPVAMRPRIDRREAAHRERA